MNREVLFRCRPHKIASPLIHHLTPPASDRALIDRQVFIRDHKVLIDTYYPSEALTLRAGAHRIIKIEHHLGRFLERQAVSLETFGKFEDLRLGTRLSVDAEAACLMPFVESRFHGVC